MRSEDITSSRPSKSSLDDVLTTSFLGTRPLFDESDLEMLALARNRRLLELFVAVLFSVIKVICLHFKVHLKTYKVYWINIFTEISCNLFNPKMDKEK